MEVTVHELELELPNRYRRDSHLYDVEFLKSRINTLVTFDPTLVTDWISNIEKMHRRRLHELIVGLDCEWRPYNRYYENPVATLQLCVGHHCLIYQLIYTDAIPRSLAEFFKNESYTFVGVGILRDLQKLKEDYNLEFFARSVDLRNQAADVYGRPELRNAGLKGLANLVLQVELEKSERVTMSRWDSIELTHDQINYACIDAFVSFEIGRLLDASSRRL